MAAVAAASTAWLLCTSKQLGRQLKGTNADLAKAEKYKCRPNQCRGTTHWQPHQEDSSWTARAIDHGNHPNHPKQAPTSPGLRQLTQTMRLRRPETETAQAGKQPYTGRPTVLQYSLWQKHTVSDNCSAPVMRDAAVCSAA